MGELLTLPNLGAEAERQLGLVGINTIEELKKVGSKEAWLRVLAIDKSACIHRLYAYEGAIRGIKKTLLPDDVKRDLKDFYNEIKGN